ncbi:hypothetical protein [Eisenbergiella massiliensis]|uniref:hypothetical protein n=1 Tax=Eisenbergiella massiliensis TaxID=1720294 RepID=UPI00399B605D
MDLMQKDRTEFAYEDFVWCRSKQSWKLKLVRKSMRIVKQNGVENVQILTPRRKGDGERQRR